MKEREAAAIFQFIMGEQHSRRRLHVKLADDLTVDCSSVCSGEVHLQELAKVLISLSERIAYHCDNSLYEFLSSAKMMPVLRKLNMIDAPLYTDKYTLMHFVSALGNPNNGRFDLNGSSSGCRDTSSMYFASYGRTLLSNRTCTYFVKYPQLMHCRGITR